MAQMNNDRASLTRYAWLSVAAALATIGLTALRYERGYCENTAILLIP